MTGENMSDEMHVEETVKSSEGDTQQDGGKRRKKRSSKKRPKRSSKGVRKVMRKKTNKRSKGASKWIMHVKAYCKKTGKTFPEALKDPVCKRSFKH
tara:strand:+ start:4881 stop:5168 length:288 start_codon:yes stop_codon:yes gene_type:complete